MATKGIDCAQPLTFEKAKAIKAAGYEFVCRYLVPERYAWKRLTRAEAEAITAAGMNIVSVFETTANRPAGGTAAGLVDGQEALKEALEIGQPKGTAIYFAVDYDAQPKDYDAIEAYLKAAQSKIEPAGYRIGIYGSFSVVAVMDERIPRLHVWQTYAWSKGAKYKGANIYQYKNSQIVAGHPVDLNESYGGEGWWNLKAGDQYPEGLSEWAKEAWKWVVEKKISDGLRPKDPVTREELWTMLHRAFGKD